MTEIAFAKLTNGAITEELGVYDLDSGLHIICLDYDIMSPGSSTHHTTRLTYEEALRMCRKIVAHIYSRDNELALKHIKNNTVYGVKGA